MEKSYGLTVGSTLQYGFSHKPIIWINLTNIKTKEIVVQEFF